MLLTFKISVEIGGRKLVVWAPTEWRCKTEELQEYHHLKIFLLRVSFSELTAQRFTPRVYGEFQKSFPAKNNGGEELKGHAEISLPWSFLGKTLQKPLKFGYFSKMLLTVIKRLSNLPCPKWCPRAVHLPGYSSYKQTVATIDKIKVIIKCLDNTFELERATSGVWWQKLWQWPPEGSPTPQT